METKWKIAGLILIVVFAGLIICPAHARKYDTMMVEPDRWIDTDDYTKKKEQTNEIVYYEGDDGEPNNVAFSERDEDPNEIVYYDGQTEPNLVALIYYSDEHPEHPNDMINEGEIEPNMASLYYHLAEHPEHPNDISSDNIEINHVLINSQTEYPEEPNDISSEEHPDPNNIEKIILDEGTANLGKEDTILPEFS